MKEFIFGFTSAIIDLFVNLFNLLPQSPIAYLVSSIDKLDIIPYINFFIPFDFAYAALSMWLLCVGTYYTYNFVMAVVNKTGIL